MSNNCKNCGAPLAENASYCTTCGASVPADPTITSQPSTFNATPEITPVALPAVPTEPTPVAPVAPAAPFTNEPLAAPTQPPVQQPVMPYNGAPMQPGTPAPGTNPYQVAPPMYGQQQTPPPPTGTYPPTGYPQQPYNTPMPMYPAPVPTQYKSWDGLAIGSMVTGILGIFLFALPLGITSLILGGSSLSKYNPNTQRGRGMAIAGIVLGIIDVLAGLVVILA